jgi:hypothetical protein
MKRFLILIFLVCLSAYKVLAQDHKTLIKQTAQRMADAAVKQDYSTLLSYTYQPFVKAHGGTDSIIAVIKKGGDIMKAKGRVLIIENAEIGAPGDEVKIDTMLYAVVPEKLTLNMNGIVYITTSSLIAISSDEGKQWYFMNAGSNNDLDDLALLLPNVKRLTIPPATGPVRVRN